MSVSENPFLSVVSVLSHWEERQWPTFGPIDTCRPCGGTQLSSYPMTANVFVKMFLLSLLFVCSTMILETGIFIELLWDQMEMKCCKHDLSSQNKYGWLLAHLCKWCWAIVHHRAGVIRCPEMVNLVQVVPDHTCYHVAERMRGKTNWLSLKVSQIMWWRELDWAHFKKLYSIPVMMLSHKILT